MFSKIGHVIRSVRASEMIFFQIGESVHCCGPHFQQKLPYGGVVSLLFPQKYGSSEWLDIRLVVLARLYYH